jgi:hypothetical protein
MEVCRFCLEREEGEKMVAPCKCRGSQQFVHKKCLEKWQETVMKNARRFPEGNKVKDVNRCSVCKEKYCESERRGRKNREKNGLLWGNKHRKIIIIAIAIGLIACAVRMLWLSGIKPVLIETPFGIRVAFIRVGDKVDELRPGVIIESTDLITEGIFLNTRILVTEYDTKYGAIGFIVNKVQTKEGGHNWIGGPMLRGVKNFIHNDEKIQGTKRITDEIYIGGIIDLRNDNIKVKALLGYCGWAPFQLDGEVRAGIWKIKGLATINDVFD